MTRGGMLLLAGLALGAAARAGAAVEAVAAGPLTLLIDHDHAVVRETFTVELPVTGLVVRVPNLPPEADLSTLSLLDRRGELQLLSWTPVQGGGSVGPAATTAGRQVRVELEPAIMPPASGVDLTLRQLSTGAKRFDLVYTLTGLAWKVTYDVLLRGDLRDVTGPMSMDVEGWVEISNATSRAFRDARILLVGTDSLGITPESKPPGFLDLDDTTPLADLWRFQQPEPDPANFYTMDRRVTLASHQTRLVSLVSVTRKPVDRMLVLRAEDIPTDTQSRFATPSQIIRFENASDFGGDRAVPPGRAMIHVGSQRSTLYQQAWFKHTPANGEIRLDLGKFTGIRARRIDRGRREVRGAVLEHTYEVRIENTFDKAIAVTIDEQPPLTLAWNPVRANQPYERLDRRLVFNPTLQPKSELVIQYTLRVEIPRN